MMSSSCKGKLFLIFSLLFFISNFSKLCTVLAIPDVNEVENVHQRDELPSDRTDNPVDSQTLQNQLDKLEVIVKNLSSLVERLESRFSDSPKVKGKGNSDGMGVRDGGINERRSEVGAVSVVKHSLFWSERFQFVSAVRMDTRATSVDVMPFRDYEGLSKYVAVGDELGKVFVFSRSGDVMVEFDTLANSPVRAILSYVSSFKNESMVITGHESGIILAHKVSEVPSGDESSSLVMETVGRFALPECGEDGSPVTLLEIHYVGRMRYIMSADVSGKIRVFRENGALYGLVVPSSRPLAFLKRRLLFLTETGAGSLDLRTMKIKESICEGLNNSVARNYVFDATDRSKAYGFTSEGDIVHVILLGDILNFKCRVRSKRKLQMEEPLAMDAIKGYLLVVNKEKVFVYNVSSHHYVRAGGPRLVLSTGFDEILASFLNYQPTFPDSDDAGLVPAIASDREKLVILNLGSGYVAMYRSKLPVSRGESNTLLWSTPVLFFITFLFAAWHFFANRKDALTSWGPDDPFTSTSVTNGAPVVSGSGERSFSINASSRNTDIMDMRGGGTGSVLSESSRRYTSPTRYAGGLSNSYRPNLTDSTSRMTSVDQDFRAQSELKFRGPNVLESTGLAKRKEGLYVNHVEDDGN